MAAATVRMKKTMKLPAKLQHHLLCFLAAAALFSPSSVLCQQQNFDVTSYGAVADGKTDNSKAFLSAWAAACKFQGSATMVIPTGTFLLGQATFAGPCFNNSSPAVSIQGDLIATPTLEAYTGPTWIVFQDLRQLVINGGGSMNGQGGVAAWSYTSCPNQRICKNMPTTLHLSRVASVSVSDITMFDPKGFNIKILQSSGVDMRDLHIHAPGDSPNTDGIHIRGSSGVTLTDIVVGTGDDCISIGPGSTNVNISGLTCGPGHGISIGSLGKFQGEKDVVGVAVRNCTLTGTTNGLRIKTWPGSPPSLAANFTFEDVVMEDVANPIIIDQVYCSVKQCPTAPSQVKIQNVAFRRVSGSSISSAAVNFKCSSAVPCEGVQLEDITLESSGGGGGGDIAATATAVVKQLISVCSNVKGIALVTSSPPRVSRQQRTVLLVLLLLYNY